MLEVCQVISAIQLPAVTHVDGSARVQTVSRLTHGRFAELLQHFHARTGCPILLNTSFNLRGETIVCLIVDAISTFGRSKIDLLVLDDFVIDRADIPPAWNNFESGQRRAGASIRRVRDVVKDDAVFNMKRSLKSVLHYLGYEIRPATAPDRYALFEDSDSRNAELLKAFTLGRPVLARAGQSHS